MIVTYQIFRDIQSRKRYLRRHSQRVQSGTGPIKSGKPLRHCRRDSEQTAQPAYKNVPSPCRRYSKSCPQRVTMRALLLLSLPLLVTAMSRLTGNQRRCWKEIQDNDKIRGSDGGLTRPGLSDPECDGVGNYKPKQCSGAECYCVRPEDKSRLRTAERSYTKNLREGGRMTCVCAAKEEEINRSGRIGEWVSCDEYGNYEPVQCTGSSCYCAHPHTGERQLDVTVHIRDRDTLDAYCTGQ